MRRGFFELHVGLRVLHADLHVQRGDEGLPGGVSPHRLAMQWWGLLLRHLQRNMSVTASKDWKENIAPDEKERFERYATILADLQRARGGKSRALHAKQHAGLRAELEVLDVPEEMRVGPFASPKKFDAYVRFSNGSGAREADDKPDLRGLAIKVLGVPGKKLIPGLEDETTQDFLFLNTESIAFSNVDDFVFFAQASTSPATLPFKLFFRFGFGTFSFLKKALASAKKIDSLATQTYFTVAPIRFGDYAARLSLLPKETGAPETETKVLGDELLARLKKAPLVWDLRAQLFVSEEKTPIEDPSRTWSEADAPFVTLAQLTIHPPGDDAEKTSALVESMSFDPWHALAELRPLGAVMRARNPAYRESTKQRKAAPEPR